MRLSQDEKKISQPSPYVNTSTETSYQLEFPGMALHNTSLRKPYILVVNDKGRSTTSYGVPKSKRVLSPQMLLKRWDHVRKCLAGPMQLTDTQQTAVLRLLRFWAYYGLVYPKAGQVAHEPEITDSMAIWRAEQGLGPPRGSYGCSRRTFWRTMRKLQERGLIEIVNRYVLRKHAQISNLYRLDKLIILIARYLSEHGQVFYQAWLKPYLLLPGGVFWKSSSSLCWGLLNTT